MATTKKYLFASLSLVLGALCLPFATSLPAWAADDESAPLPLVSQYSSYNEDADALAIVPTATWAAGRTLTLDEASAFANDFLISVYSSSSSILRVDGDEYDDEQTVTAEVDFAAQLRFREKFPVLRERDHGLTVERPRS